MLVNLAVKNFAIIDNINIDFKNHMTVLTGETGAGKSLIIDAIGLLFGDRASSEMVRYGETKATIEGVFVGYDQKLNELLNEFGVDEEEELIIRRDVLSSGKSVCRVNGCAINLSQLEEISYFLGDIHTQFDTHRLINPKNYLSFIDDEIINSLLLEYKDSLSNYRKIKREYNLLVQTHDEETKQLDFFKFQLQELNKANLSLTEEEDLKSQADYLNNYEVIATNINDAMKSLDSISELYDAMTSLSKVEKFDNNYAQYVSIISDCYYQLEDIQSSLSKVSFDESKLSELDYINERLMVYSDMRRKHKMSTEEIINYQEGLQEKIDSFENYDFKIGELEKALTDAYNKTMAIALEIRALRQEKSSQLEKSIVDNLIDLELKDTLFKIEFNLENTKFFENGIDEVNFMVTFNKGETLKPLNKVASGGELSRFMLALKSILSKNMVNQTIIFDEIDSGVSGKVAYSIAQKISSISEFAQVLCITHLPQVAAICDNHIALTKEVVNGRTITVVNELELDDRIREIAKMISNGDISDSSISLARELIQK